MTQQLELVDDYRGFPAGTTFVRVATYGEWHVAAVKLKPTHGTSRIEVSRADLEARFRPVGDSDGGRG
jgi:hypothetical protein